MLSIDYQVSLYVNKSRLNKSGRRIVINKMRNNYITITDKVNLKCILTLQKIFPPNKSINPILKLVGRYTVELIFSLQQKMTSIFAHISKFLPLDDTKFISKIELKLGAKESQLSVYEVMELCQE